METSVAGWSEKSGSRIRSTTWLKKKVNFEQAASRLEEIVRLLEQGDAPLEDSLALFEEGTALMKKCTTMLDKAEQKVRKLTAGPNGEPVESLMDQEEDV